MSLLARFIPNILTSFSQATVATVGVNSFGGLYELSVRSIMRCHFPRPNERKRILRHGWKARMATRAGRRILMNRILKGRHVYSH